MGKLQMTKPKMLTDEEIDHAYRKISRALTCLWNDDLDLFAELMEELSLAEEYQALSSADQAHLCHEFAEVGRHVDQLVAEANGRIRAALDRGMAA
jgi:hypothetical protein